MGKGLSAEITYVKLTATIFAEVDGRNLIFPTDASDIVIIPDTVSAAIGKFFTESITNTDVITKTIEINLVDIVPILDGSQEFDGGVLNGNMLNNHILGRGVPGLITSTDITVNIV